MFDSALRLVKSPAGQMPPSSHIAFSRLKCLSSTGQVRLVLGLMETHLTGYLIFANKPWSVSVAAGKTWKTFQFVTVYSGSPQPSISS